MKAEIVDAKGKKINEIELNEDIFNRKLNETLVHQVVTAEMTNKRQGNASTKTRAMISGGGVKPWRQKGTGRARAGSNRSPLWKGGGIIFGPSPKDYYTRIPRKLRKGAIKSVLSAKLKNSELVIIDKIEIKEPKTKAATLVLKDLNIKGKTTIILPEANETIEKSFRNIPAVNVISIDKISTYDVLDNKNLLITGDAVQKLTEVLS
jgi:large subunit ribosomal protein L4